jgi:hypothetical protein
MVFLRDEGSVLAAPLDAVWRFVSSGNHHSDAHGHRNVSRRVHSGDSGTYSWDQDFDGKPERFTMRWTAFHPVGIAYDVLEGPFTGSRFFLVYQPQGARTAVSIVGEFTSPTLPAHEVEAAALRFFAVEFEQDRAAMEHDLAGPRRTSPSRKPSTRTNPRR